MENNFLQVVAEVLDVDVSELSMDTEYINYERWDSLAMMNMVMELEEEFHVSIPIEKLADVKILEDLFVLVK